MGEPVFTDGQSSCFCCEEPDRAGTYDGERVKTACHGTWPDFCKDAPDGCSCTFEWSLDAWHYDGGDCPPCWYV